MSGTTDEDDLIIGSPSLDVRRGGFGDDTILGLGGNDFLYGDADNDRLEGGADDDVLQGGLGADTITGNDGRDRLLGGAGADSMLGGAGNDLAIGSDGNDTIAGEDGHDSLFGGDGADSLAGGAGHDLLLGGAGADTLLGGAGDDLYFVDDLGDIVIDLPGETGNSVIASVTWTLAAGFGELYLDGGALALDGTGNAIANLIDGNPGANLLRGLAGDDTLLGDDGDDTIEGGAGNDSLHGGAGADSMVGGAGNDDYIVENAADIVVELAGGGADRVFSTVSWTLGAEFEHLSLANEDDIAGTGNARDNRIFGNSGANLIIGLDGADTLDGRRGADTLEGGAGNDFYRVDDVGDREVEAAGGGIDHVEASVSWTLGDGLDHLTLVAGAVDGTGNALANAITGNGARNTLLGLDGNDTIEGGTGGDTITGGAGADRLRGGEGADVFIYTSASEGRDRLIGYNGLEDTLVISAAGFGGGLTTLTDLLLQGRYIASATPVANSAAGIGQFIWEFDAGRLWWDADGAGGAAAALIALMPDAIGMNAYEILLV